MFGRIFKQLGAAAAAGFVLLLSILPYRLAYYLVQGVVRIFVSCIPRLRRVGRRNLEAVFPELSAAEREAILSQSLKVFASNLLHLARIRKMGPDYLKTHSNIDQIVPYYRQVRGEGAGKSVLFTSGHFGDFELLMPFKGFFCGGGVGIARPFGLPLLDTVWNARREISGCKILSRNGAFREMIAALQSGNDASLLFDQNVKMNHAIFSDLFGIKAATARSAGLAVVRTDVPVLFATLNTVTPFGKKPSFHFHLEQIPTEDIRAIESPDAQVQLLTDRLNSALEKAVRADPKQWFWIHRRFKTRPPGEAENFYN